MTEEVGPGLSAAVWYQGIQDNGILGIPESPNSASVVIPAQAGIHARLDVR